MENQWENEMARKIKDGLDGLEGNITVRQPDLQAFMNLVVEVEEKQKTQIKKEFMIFLFVAISTLVFTTCAYYSYFMVFIGIQLLVTATIPFGILKWHRKQYGQVN